MGITILPLSPHLYGYAWMSTKNLSTSNSLLIKSKIGYLVSDIMPVAMWWLVIIMWNDDATFKMVIYIISY